ncbi:MAG: pitrilysin family protein [Saprospiraceae bacterium]
MKVDRSRGPEIKKITKLNLPEIKKTTLTNGVKLIEINIGTQELVQVEVLYTGGRLNEQKKGFARATARLSKEGTVTYTSSEIAEKIDFYGANISSGASLDYSFVKLFVLSKFLYKVLPIFSEIIYSPIFPKEELQKYKTNSLQRLIVEQSKSEIMAYKTLTEKLYGQDHPYGYNSSKEIYDSINTEDLINYHKNAFTPDKCTIIISGSISEDIRQLVIDTFGQKLKGGKPLEYKKPIKTIHNEKIFISTGTKLQSSIKIGRRLFDRSHPDFIDLFITNTILGGYFGSRLMTTLREQKGYTYNIYSSIDMMIYGGYFNISTEVGNEHIEDTIEGIYHEMEILKNELVSNEELEMVKNYLSGNFLNMIDGPFKVAGMAKVVALNNLSFDFYKRIMDRIQTITPIQIRLIAQKYFDKEKMIEVIAGE